MSVPSGTPRCVVRWVKFTRRPPQAAPVLTSKTRVNVTMRKCCRRDTLGVVSIKSTRSCTSQWKILTKERMTNMLRQVGGAGAGTVGWKPGRHRRPLARQARLVPGIPGPVSACLAPAKQPGTKGCRRAAAGHT